MTADAEAAPPPGSPGAREQLRAWFAIGTQSLGGGPSTLYMVRATLVARRSWLSMHEFVQDWTLSRVSIGNHMTALAALIGHRIDGRRGVLVALAGLLIPSGVITAAMTGGFGFIRDLPAIQAALAGIAPVTIGMMLGLSFTMLRSTLGPRSSSLPLDLAVFGIATAAGFLVSEATVVVIVAGAVFGALFLGRDAPPPETVEG